MDRRSFVRRLPVLAGAAAGAGSLLAAGCAGAAYVVPRSVGGGRLAVSTDAVTGDGVFVAHPSDERPIFLSRGTGGTAVAVHARCTHRGCQPDAVAGRLACPCHGSEFALDGTVLEGPAGTPLRRFTVTEQEGEWIIWLEGGRR